MHELSVRQRQQLAERNVSQLGKTYAQARFMLPSATAAPAATPTGIPELDRALIGIEGIPSGRLCEVFGPEGSGKTIVALSAAANAQRSGRVVAYLDVEHRLEPRLVSALGVAADQLLVYRPTTAEQAFDITVALLNSGHVGFVVIDTVASLVPRREFEAVVDWVPDADWSGLIARALRKLAIIAARNDASVLLLNQIRTKVGVMFGNPETTPGGHALRSHAALRIGLRKTSHITQNKAVVGSTIRASVVKNSFGVTGTSAEFSITASQGVLMVGAPKAAGIKQFANAAAICQGHGVDTREVTLGRHLN
jgi:recombination protein RecA